jgi:hypothetical protein
MLIVRNHPTMAAVPVQAPPGVVHAPAGVATQPAVPMARVRIANIMTMRTTTPMAAITPLSSRTSRSPPLLPLQALSRPKSLLLPEYMHPPNSRERQTTSSCCADRHTTPREPVCPKSHCFTGWPNTPLARAYRSNGTTWRSLSRVTSTTVHKQGRHPQCHLVAGLLPPDQPTPCLHAAGSRPSSGRGSRRCHSRPADDAGTDVRRTILCPTPVHWSVSGEGSHTPRGV